MKLCTAKKHLYRPLPASGRSAPASRRSRFPVAVPIIMGTSKIMVSSGGIEGTSLKLAIIPMICANAGLRRRRSFVSDIKVYSK